MQADSRDENFEFVSYHTRRIESIANRKTILFLAPNFSATFQTDTPSDSIYFKFDWNPRRRTSFRSDSHPDPNN
jgi:hypothetical protein